MKILVRLTAKKVNEDEKVMIMANAEDKSGDYVIPCGSVDYLPNITIGVDYDFSQKKHGEDEDRNKSA